MKRLLFVCLAASFLIASSPIDVLAGPGGTTESLGLTVAPESRCSPYNSRDYSYPRSLEKCVIAGMDGQIYTPYSGTRFKSRRQIDIEHIVARSEAHDSGLCSADPETRKRFARDLRNLTLATPTVNRHLKGYKDAGEWLPDRNKCWFADRVVEVKRKYQMTVDSREAQALESVLSGCDSVEIVYLGD